MIPVDQPGSARLRPWRSGYNQAMGPDSSLLPTDVPFMHPPSRVARYGLTSFLAHLAHGVLDALPWPLRPLLWRCLLGRMGRGVILEYRVFIRPPRYVAIGDDVYIGRGAELWAHSSVADIVIGDHVLIGPGALLTTLGHQVETLAMPPVARAVSSGV